jgi:hypothetical protein
MKKFKLQKVIINSLIVTSVLALSSIGASAEWRQDSNGWWNSEGSSWSVGWKEIDGEWYYFNSNGYMKTGWLNDNGTWYYLYNSGAMAKNTIIDGYSVGSDGAWIEKATQNSSEQSTSTQNSLSGLSNVNPNATTISGVTGIKSSDITKIVFYDGRGNKPLTVDDKQKVKEFMGYLDGYIINKTKNPETTGWAQEAIFYINDKEVINITFGDPIIINNDYYKIIQGGLDTDKIDEFLKLIDPSHLTSAELNEKSN